MGLQMLYQVLYFIFTKDKLLKKRIKSKRGRNGAINLKRNQPFSVERQVSLKMRMNYNPHKMYNNLKPPC